MHEIMTDVGAITGLVVALTAIAGLAVTLHRHRERLRRQERLELAFDRAQTLRNRGSSTLFARSKV